MANDGAAVRVTGQSEPGSTANLEADKKNIITKSVGGNAAGASSVSANTNSPVYNYSPVENPLDQFVSYTQLFTLAVLTKEQFNDPSIYRQDNLAYLNDFFTRDKKVYQAGVVFSSAGRYDELRVKTYFGVPEYFVNNFQMTAAITPREKTGNSNALNFKFDVYEPYSMGLFLQSLQNAAEKAGYKSYLDNCPYLLKIDFQGYTGNGLSTGKFSKYFPLRLLGVKMEVSESGSNYKVEAVPYNHTGFSNVVNKTFKDIQLQGSSIKELLAFGEFSLSAILNDQEKKNAADKKNQSIPNEYLFVFPKDGHDPVGVASGTGASDGGATTNFEYIPLKVGKDPSSVNDFGDNPIGNSSMGFDSSRGGNFVMPLEGDVYDPETGKINRDKVVIDPKARAFQFAQGQSITDIIVQLIGSSKFAFETFKTIKEDGTIDWYKIDVQIKLLEYDPLTKDYAKKIIYRIVPYSVHHSVYMNPTSAPVGYKRLEQKIAKKYDYIYTGKNDHVIKFDIKFDTLFYSSAAPAAAADAGGVKSQAVQSLAPGSETRFQSPDAGQGDSVASSNSPIAPVKSGPEALEPSYPGGAGDVRTEKMIAETFQRNLTTKGDMIKVNLDILGDPYWLVDSGMGNYFSPKDNDAVTIDGTMTYEGSEVYAILEFITPRDVNPVTGLYEFRSMGSSRSEFGGIYKVLDVTSKFSDGKFTQTLGLTRMPGQASDYLSQTVEPKVEDKAKAFPDVAEGQVDPSAPETESQVA